MYIYIYICMATPDRPPMLASMSQPICGGSCVGGIQRHSGPAVRTAWQFGGSMSSRPKVGKHSFHFSVLCPTQNWDNNNYHFSLLGPTQSWRK